ncbi:MAG: Uma2 family endonuclease [Bryobacteraceae bacterium]|jgi:Uma2 family endonuclease
MSMNAVLAQIEEYLDTDYSPDREFVDGMVVERHVGDRGHSRVQFNVIFSLGNRFPKLFIWPEQRVRTTRNRRRIPDVCVTTQDPFTDVFETPPLICIEILSRRDEMSDVLEKLEEYAAAGVRYIWIVDPRLKKAFFYDGGLREVTSGVLVTADEPVVELPLAEVFRDI